jgi:hypothetical protein
MNFISIQKVAVVLCLTMVPVGAVAVSAVVPTASSMPRQAQEADAVRRDLDQAKADLRAEREARTSAESSLDEARAGSRIFLLLALFMAGLAVATIVLVAASARFGRPEWLRDLMSGGQQPDTKAGNPDKERRAAQAKLDEWLRNLARELEVNPGSDAAEEALDQDRAAIRRAGEPGLGVSQRPQSTVPGAVPARPVVPVGQPAPAGQSSTQVASEVKGTEQIRESTALVTRLAIAGQQRFDGSRHVERLDAADALLRATLCLAPKRPARSPECRGEDAAGCIELARAAVELTQAWASVGKLDRAKSSSETAGALFSAALSWLADKDDIQVHLEQAQLFVARAFIEETEDRRVSRLGEALSEVHAAQRKNRIEAAPGTGGATASRRVADPRMESRLQDLAFAIRLDALGIPSLKDLSGSEFTAGANARVRRDGVELPVSVAEPEATPATFRPQGTAEPKVKLDLGRVAAWATTLSQTDDHSFDAARPINTAPMNPSPGRSLAWGVMRLRLELCSDSLGGFGATSVFSRPSSGFDLADPGFSDGGFGSGVSDYKQSLFDAVDPSLPADPREPGLSHADLVALRHLRLLRLASPFGSPSESSGSSLPGSSVPANFGRFGSSFASAVGYFAKLVSCRQNGRAAPTAETLKGLWSRFLDAGLNDRTGLFEGPRANHADEARHVPGFFENYWAGLCFAKAPQPPKPPETEPVVGGVARESDGPKPSCVLLPIRGRDAAGRDVVRGLRLVDLSTAYRDGDGPAREREVTQRERLRLSLDGKRVVIEAGSTNAWMPVRRKGIFGLELSAYQVAAQVSETVVEIDGGVKVNCLQLAELRFDMIETIEGNQGLRVQVMDAQHLDATRVAPDMSGFATGMFTPAAPTVRDANPQVLCSCELASRAWAIVPERAPLRVAPWSVEQLREVMPFYTQLLVYLAGDLDQSTIRPELSAALRSMHEQFGAARDGNEDLKYDDQVLGLLAFQAMRMAGWRHRKQGIDREWQWILALMPAAVEPFVRLLQLEGNQTLLGAAVRHGIKAPDQPVQVTIQQPGPGSVHREGSAISLQASARALDGSNLSSSIRWSSSLQGELGTGAALSASALRQGTHVLSATAVDASGRSGSAQVSIVVGDASSAAPTPGPVWAPPPNPTPLRSGNTLSERVASYAALAGSYIPPPPMSSPPSPAQLRNVEALVRSAQGQLQANPAHFELGRQLLADIAGAGA